MLLRLMGHAASVAHTGEDAVACAATDRPQVVLLDISLPDMDGYEVARQIRARHGQAIRLIALAGGARTRIGVARAKRGSITTSRSLHSQTPSSGCSARKSCRTPDIAIQCRVVCIDATFCALRWRAPVSR